MARTYRLRHMPKFPDGPRRYVDGVGWKRWVKPRRMLETLYAETFGYRCYSDDQMVRMLKVAHPVIVACPGGHPYIGWYSVAAAPSHVKKQRRREGYRQARRATHTLCDAIRRGAVDPDESIFPDLAEFIDPWDVT